VKITYDKEADALYIQFRDTPASTQHLSEGIAADCDADGYLAGLEILDAATRIGDPELFRQVTLGNLASQQSP